MTSIKEVLEIAKNDPDAPASKLVAKAWENINGSISTTTQVKVTAIKTGYHVTVDVPDEKLADFVRELIVLKDFQNIMIGDFR